MISHCFVYNHIETNSKLIIRKWFLYNFILLLILCNRIWISTGGFQTIQSFLVQCWTRVEISDQISNEIIHPKFTKDFLIIRNNIISLSSENRQTNDTFKESFFVLLDIYQMSNQTSVWQKFNHQKFFFQKLNVSWESLILTFWCSDIYVY